MSSLGARSVHVVFSFGFCDVGVKKLDTADSARFQVLAMAHAIGGGKRCAWIHTRRSALEPPLQGRRGNRGVGGPLGRHGREKAG